MNQLKVTISNISHEGDLTLLKAIHEKGDTFSVMMLDLPKDVKLGEEVTLVFKETEVMLGSLGSRVSARNCFEAQVSGVQIGALVCIVSLDYQGCTIRSLITKEAFYELGIDKMQKCLWFVKSNEVAITKL